MWGAIGTLIAAPARGNESCYEVLRLLDSTPVACGTSRETVKRCDLTGYAGYGYCASRSRYFWDFRLQLISTSEGKPVIWGLAHLKLGEREVAGALLRHDHRLVRDGQAISFDKGFAVKDFERFVTEELGVNLVRRDRKNGKTRFGKFGVMRQWIESVYDSLKG